MCDPRLNLENRERILLEGHFWDNSWNLNIGSRVNDSIISILKSHDCDNYMYWSIWGKRPWYIKLSLDWPKVEQICWRRKLCYLAFYYCDQNIWQEQPGEGKRLFWLTVSEVQSMVGLLHCSGPEMRQHTVTEGVVEERCSVHGSQEGGRGGEGRKHMRNQRQKNIPKGTYFLQPHSICLQSSLSNPFKLLIHPMDWSN